MSSSSTILLAICALAAYQLEVTFSHTIPISVSPEDDFMCIQPRFPKNHICSTLFPNLTSVMAPNPSQINERRNGFLTNLNPRQHFEDSLVQFEQLERLFLSTFAGDTCSDKIATLLCFFYFPSCNEVELGNSTPKFTAFPCRSLCEEVTAIDSECTKRFTGSTWGPHFLGCNYTYGGDSYRKQVYTEKNCVNSTHPIQLRAEDQCKKISPCKYNNNVIYLYIINWLVAMFNPVILFF